MVEPMASKGQQKNMLTFPAAVTDATAADPREFTAVCKITEPMAVMEYCRPMGTPMLQSTLIWSVLILHSSLVICRISNFFIM